MVYDLQKAGILKRVSALILDFIIITVLAAGLAFVVSEISGYDSYSDKLDGYYSAYESEYGVKFDISAEEFEALGEAGQKKYNEAYAALAADKGATETYSRVVNLTLLMLSVSILLAYAITDFIIPLVLKNGQTVGKKVFGIALMRTNGVRISSVQLFVRTFIGKYTIETMVPALIAVMIFFNSIGILGAVILGLLLVLQLVLICATRTNSLIHDLLADTVAVDLQMQNIFDSEEARIEHEKRVAAENAASSKYF